MGAMSRRSPAPLAHLCVWAVVAALAGGCVRVVPGRGEAAVTVPGPPDRPVVLADVLPAPDRFPPDYPAAVLDPAAADAAIRAVDAVPAGAVVDPPECTPPAPGPGPADAVAVQGRDPDTGAELTVALTRTGTDPAVRRDQLAACPSFTVTVAGGEAEQRRTVHTELRPRPPVDADGTFAVAVEVDGDPPARLLVLVAQIGEVRVTAAWRGDDPDADPDSTALDALFTDAVLQVRRAVRP